MKNRFSKSPKLRALVLTSTVLLGSSACSASGDEPITISTIPKRPSSTAELDPELLNWGATPVERAPDQEGDPGVEIDNRKTGDFAILRCTNDREVGGTVNIDGSVHKVVSDIKEPCERTGVLDLYSADLLNIVVGLDKAVKDYRDRTN